MVGYGVALWLRATYMYVIRATHAQGMLTVHIHIFGSGQVCVYKRLVCRLVCKHM
jgi:hypothetical protein